MNLNGRPTPDPLTRQSHAPNRAGLTIDPPNKIFRRWEVDGALLRHPAVQEVAIVECRISAGRGAPCIVV